MRLVKSRTGEKRFAALEGSFERLISIPRRLLKPRFETDQLFVEDDTEGDAFFMMLPRDDEELTARDIECLDLVMKGKIQVT
ncbi:MAG: hypothetical protein JRG97_08920 [Deltaproteobacteria bacterium]|nr:hypothetical protein [Deltaproteobacteria bacterium]MBW2050924.1 hypothetical protein [Deltaproteobacteria bacterium]MBW2141179.1 hypothetical protein [Deltaproteobacteria bacterium]MBW2323705.1 hypothetical protein [Deltaproteobacteria bacterium]